MLYTIDGLALSVRVSIAFYYVLAVWAPPIPGVIDMYIQWRDPVYEHMSPPWNNNYLQAPEQWAPNGDCEAIT